MTATQLMLLQLMTAWRLPECRLSRNSAVVVLSILHSLAGHSRQLAGYIWCLVLPLRAAICVLRINWHMYKTPVCNPHMTNMSLTLRSRSHRAKHLPIATGT